MTAPDDWDCDDEWELCQECLGEGEIVVCFDDICQGQAYCMHGDGMQVCDECKGEGEVYYGEQRSEP